MTAEVFNGTLVFFPSKHWEQKTIFYPHFQGFDPISPLSAGFPPFFYHGFIAFFSGPGKIAPILGLIYI